MRKIRQFPYGNDNLGYLVYGQKKAMAIDGGAPTAIIDFIREKGLTLEYVTNTHSHSDHTTGNQALIEQTGAPFLDFDRLMTDGAVDLEGRRIQVMHTPGHTMDSVCFHFDDILVSGDTLFNGKVGRCFTGDHVGFFQSIKRIRELPGETKVYAGHDYVMEYLEFTRQLEPDNPHIDAYRQKYDPDNLFYTLAEEIRVNPYLRINDENVAAILKGRGLPAETELDRWQSLLSLM